MKNKFLVIASFLFVSLAANTVAGFWIFNLRADLARAQKAAETRQNNEKVLLFSEMVVEKVLKAQGEVGFDDRLRLENAVRETKDGELLEQWNKFTASQTEIEAQTEMKNLLGILVKKIKNN